MTIFLGNFKGGETVPYAIAFHGSDGNVADPASVAARHCTPAGVWESLTAPAQQDSKTGLFGGTIDTTGFATGLHMIAVSGVLPIAATRREVFAMRIIANTEADVITDTTSILGYVQNIATTGATAYDSAASFTKTTGGTEVNTFASTDTANGIYHQIPDSAGTLDGYYEYHLREDEVAVGVTFKGRIMSSNDTAVLQVYDWANTAWVTVATLSGTNTTTDTTITPSLVSKYTGTTSPNVGKVRVRIYGTGLTSANVYVDQCIVAKANTSRTVGYSQGAIWIDSSHATTGTTPYYNGTADNPVNVLPDALSLAATLGIYRFQVAPGTALTLAANAKKHAFAGKGYKLAMAGYDLSYATIDGCELVTGVCTCADWEAFFWNCQFGQATVGEVDLHNCHMTDMLTLGSAAPYLLNGCVGVPIGTPGIDFGAAIAGSAVVMGSARGVWEIRNMHAGDTLIVDGACDLTLASSCAGGTVYIAGNVRLTNNGTGQTLYNTTPLLAGSYTAPDNAGITAIGLKTVNLPNDPASQSAVEMAISEATPVIDLSTVIEPLEAVAADVTDIQNMISAAAFTVTVVSPVNEAGVLELLSGDDYKDDYSRQIEFTVADASHLLPLASADSIYLEIADDFSVSGTATSITTGWDMVFQATHDDTDLLEIGGYEFRCIAYFGTDKVTFFTGDAIVS